MSILIKNVQLNGKETHIYIEENRISEIGKKLEAHKEMEGKGKIAFPGFYNTHTHAAMTLLRGYADDMQLMPWLQEKIWPLEARLQPEDVYWGTKLAILEMIKTGTVFFNDMYFFMEKVVDAVEEMGVRAALSYGFIDLFDEEKREKEIKKTENLVNYIKNKRNSRIMGAVGPHAVYTVSKEGLQWCKEFAAEKNIFIHIHVSETEEENRTCQERYGMSPFKLLDSVGILNKRCVAAHSVWVGEKEIQLIARKGAVVSFNPTSNMKLAVGSMLKYREMKEKSVHLTLGTDGCSSNNNLDMVEEMKFAAIGLKSFYKDPELAPAAEVFKIATENGAKAFELNGGKVAEGHLADLILVDEKTTFFTPNHNPISNLVYASPGSVVDTTICHGKVLMENRKVKGEEEILFKARERAKKLLFRCEESF